MPVLFSTHFGECFFVIKIEILYVWNVNNLYNKKSDSINRSFYYIVRH